MGSCLGSCVTAEAATNTSTTSSSTSTASSSSTASTSSCVAAAAAANSWLWRRRRPRARLANDEQAEQEPETELISSGDRTDRDRGGQRCQQRRGLVYRILKFKRKQQCPQFLDKYWEQQPSYAKLQNDSAISDIQLQNLDVFKLLNAQATPSKETEMHGNYQRMASSRASSSLDLEWEHEYSQLRNYQQEQKEQKVQPAAENENTPPMAAKQPRYASLDQLATAASMAAGSHGRHGAARYPRLGSHRHGGSFTRTSCCSSTQNSWSHISTPESLEWDVDEEREQQLQLRQEDDNLDDETLKLLHQIEQLKHHVLQETGDGLSMGAVAVVGEVTEGLQFRATHFGGGSELEASIS
ncbi:LOW QUALITY PROTEIN: uncharacterized protein LOC111082882 [Drosophila obscura]|uniref:LOW QUALITY PROTEIN: uncharacterized protein LOC111082882 n=1 Tax=Drosophila obscura TaxID=7282 RepID=UPI001BB16590|nr:LOW QUALITY PROTEIN: uncharacterized protein LOC111082882 [Drosophila obscura]